MNHASMRFTDSNHLLNSVICIRYTTKMYGGEKKEMVEVTDSFIYLWEE